MHRNEKRMAMFKKLTYIGLCFVVMAYSGEIKEIAKMKEAWSREMKGACYELGMLYEQGLSAEQNITISMKYYDKACSLGYEKACQSFDRLQSKDLIK